MHTHINTYRKGLARYGKNIERFPGAVTGAVVALRIQTVETRALLSSGGDKNSAFTQTMTTFEQIGGSMNLNLGLC